MYVLPENLRTYLAVPQVNKLHNGYMDVFARSNRNATWWATRRPRPLLFGNPVLHRKLIGYVLNQAALELMDKVVLKTFLPNATDSREDVLSIAPHHSRAPAQHHSRAPAEPVRAIYQNSDIAFVDSCLVWLEMNE